jgi:drug/metabolite transporter (DMT)-like permease
MASPHERLPPKGLLLLAALSLFWGLNWPIMKVVLSEIPPLYFRAFCLLGGGSGLLLIARASGIVAAVAPGEWPRLLALSLFNILGWNVFAVYGVLLLSSGRAALLGYTMPVWGVILSVYMLGERFTARRCAGLVLGVAGIFTLMSDSFAGIMQAPVGATCMVAAALSWAFGIVLIKRLPVSMPTIAMTGWMMLLAGVPIAVAAVALEPSRLFLPSFWPAFGLAYNVLIAFMFCYWAWNRIVLMVPVAVSSLSSLTTPLIGVLGGVFFLGETLGWREIVAALLILAAVGTVSIRR